MYPPVAACPRSCRPFRHSGLALNAADNDPIHVDAQKVRPGTGRAVMLRCRSCGMPQTKRYCPLCGSLLFSETRVREFGTDQLRTLARDLAATKRRIEAEITAVNSSLPAPFQRPDGPVTPRSPSVRRRKAHASSDHQTLLALVWLLERQLRAASRELEHARKVRQFAASEGPYPTTTTQSVRTISAGLPERNRRRF